MELKLLVGERTGFQRTGFQRTGRSRLFRSIGIGRSRLFRSIGNGRSRLFRSIGIGHSRCIWALVSEPGFFEISDFQIFDSQDLFFDNMFEKYVGEISRNK